MKNDSMALPIILAIPLIRKTKLPLYNEQEEKRIVLWLITSYRHTWRLLLTLWTQKMVSLSFSQFDRNVLYHICSIADFTFTDLFFIFDYSLISCSSSNIFLATLWYWVMWVLILSDRIDLLLFAFTPVDSLHAEWFMFIRN